MIIEDEGAMELGSDHNLIWPVCYKAKPTQELQPEK